MEIDTTEAGRKLKEFKIRNANIHEQIGVGTKLLKPSEILVPVRGRILTGCTDERRVSKLIDPKSGESLSLSGYTIARATGAAFGLVDAIRNVKVTIRRGDILKALSINDVVAANHIDTHSLEGELTGCGQGALRALPESGYVFDRPMHDLGERMRSYEEVGTLRLVLDGEHTAQGLLVNPFSDQALDPARQAAEHSFFALDLGLYREILAKIQNALGFNDEDLTNILVKLTRNNLAAVFILSKATINEAVYIERADDDETFYTGVLHGALGEVKKREASVVRMLQDYAAGLPSAPQAESAAGQA